MVYCTVGNGGGGVRRQADVVAKEGAVMCGGEGEGGLLRTKSSSTVHGGTTPVAWVYGCALTRLLVCPTQSPDTVLPPPLPQQRVVLGSPL